MKKAVSVLSLVLSSINPLASQARLSCDAIRPLLYEKVVPFYQSYSSETYMNLYCARNSRNFYEKNREFLERHFKDKYAIYIVNQDVSKVISPQSNREAGLKRWTYHVVLLFDGQVVDMDYREKGIEGIKLYRNMPSLIDLKSYLHKMFGNQLEDLVFQIRPIDKIDDLTEVEVDDSIRRGEHSLLSSQEIMGLSSSLRCGSMETPYYQRGADKPH